MESKPSSSVPKELILATLTVIVGVVSAYVWKAALLASGFPGFTFYSIPILTLLVFGTLFSLSALFIDERGLRSGVALISCITGYLFIPYSATVLAGAVLSGLGGWHAANQIATEVKASQLFSLQKFLRAGTPLFFTAFALFLAVAYYASIGNRTDAALLPKSLFNAAIPLIQKPLEGVLPGFRADASVDDLLLAFAIRELGSTVDVSKLSVSQKSELVAQGRAALAAQFGVKLNGTEKASDVLYTVTNKEVGTFLGPYRQYIPLITAIGFFVAVKTLTLPIYWITLLIVFFVVKLLKALKILHIETGTIKVERLVL